MGTMIDVINFLFRTNRMMITMGEIIIIVMLRGTKVKGMKDLL